ncbi:hypothetical protein [Kibdelosporangium phytohabitans]|uniref:Uncharacterized protein n=1 Tax=Kibdelosporangium phytohabitans TaxID=860235 RepID=A0A0N9I2N1_9PSEU|nr:hypothetical protein [Kibdelosporangium phytohabitans]ALG08470.1 hypothetical protein AOZ06_17500 [Kibdelosporangium phytohabitans]MBE1470468.1 hypothetical protein [Kibdelosporangium phytohabitans]
MSAIEYFCYVSRNKIDQLYQQIDPEADYEITELAKQETDRKTDWKTGQILKLFSAGRSYGKKDVLQREAKVKQTYLEKLERVMFALATETPIPAASELDRWDMGLSSYYHHTGVFRFESKPIEPSTNTVVTLVSSIGQRRLLLDCSLRNFSEGPRPDGTFDLNSANDRFFRGDMSMTMTTVFLLLEAGQSRVIGSPLFLKLSLPESDWMTML